MTSDSNQHEEVLDYSEEEGNSIHQEYCSNLQEFLLVRFLGENKALTPWAECANLPFVMAVGDLLFS